MSLSTSSDSRARTESPAELFLATEQLRHWVAVKGEDPFLRCGGEWRSYAQVQESSDRLAAGLTGLGLARGDRVAVILPNREEYFPIIFACAKLGLIQVPLNAYLKGEFLLHQLGD